MISEQFRLKIIYIRSYEHSPVYATAPLLASMAPTGSSSNLFTLTYLLDSPLISVSRQQSVLCMQTRCDSVHFASKCNV